jgi:hypothetical protein
VRSLIVVVQVALTVFCLVDCIQSPSAGVRTMPKWAWIVLILFFPSVGPVAWLIAGRPPKLAGGTSAFRDTGQPAGPARPVAGRRSAPDDDPEFLRRMAEAVADEARLRRWEDDLHRRERERRDGEDPNRTS